MNKLNWKISIACLTFLIGTLLTLIWLTQINTDFTVVELQQNFPKISVSEVEVKETSFDKKTLATKNLDSRNETDDTDFNPPIRYIKNGGKFCEKYILRKIALEKSGENRLITLKNFNPQDENLSPNVKKWLSLMREEDLNVTQLKNTKQEVFLLSSTALAATGLSTSLENWHIEIDNVYSEGFWSFSKNPNLIFWDKKGKLNYYLIEYSDDFLSASSKRDYDNLTYNIEHYKIEANGTAKLLKEEKNLKCK